MIINKQKGNYPNIKPTFTKIINKKEIIATLFIF